MAKALLATFSICVVLLSSPECDGGLITYNIEGVLRQSYTSSRTLLVPRFDPSLGTLQAITLNINPEISGTVYGIGNGPPNSPNGWATWFSGNLTLSGPGFSVTWMLHIQTVQDLVYQPGTPVFQNYAPSIRPIEVVFATSLASYVGTGNRSISISHGLPTPRASSSHGQATDCHNARLGCSGKHRDATSFPSFRQFQSHRAWHLPCLLWFPSLLREFVDMQFAETLSQFSSADRSRTSCQHTQDPSRKHR